MDNTLKIRPMTPADCDRVAEIRVTGWRNAYRGLMPQSYLDALDVSRDAERRRAYLAQGEAGGVNLVAERGGTLVGWVCHGPYRDGEVHTGDAELYALYADPRHLGTGIGRALLQESVRRCVETGHARMLLWVVKGNTRARRFYERAGFGADGAEESFDVAGTGVPEVRYVRELTYRR